MKNWFMRWMLVFLMMLNLAPSVSALTICEYPEDTSVDYNDWLYTFTNDCTTTSRAKAVTVVEGALFSKGIRYTKGATSSAITAAGSTAGVLVIDTNETLASNITIPSTLVPANINGAKLTVPTGVTVTVNSTSTLFDLSQIFSCTGTGSVVFTSPKVRVQSAWFGTDNAALQMTINATPSGGTAVINPKATYYSISTSLAVATNNITIDVQKGVELRPSTTHLDIFSVTGNYVSLISDRAVMQGYGTYYSGTSGASFIKSTGNFTTVKGFYLKECETSPIRFEGNDGLIENNWIEGGTPGPIGSSRTMIGIWLRSNGASPSRHIVRNNRIFPNGTNGRGIEGVFGGSQAYPLVDCLFEGNEITGVFDHAFYLVATGSTITNNITYKSGAIKVQMPAYTGTPQKGNVISHNSGNNIGMESDELGGDSFINLGNAENTLVYGNNGINYQNAGILVSGTDSPYYFGHNKIFDNTINTIVNTNLSWTGGMVVADSNLATYEYNEVNNNKFINIGVDNVGTPAGVLFDAISNTGNHIGNSFNYNTIKSVHGKGLALYYVSYGQVKGNRIYDTGKTVAADGMKLYLVNGLDVSDNFIIGTSTQLTYGIEESGTCTLNHYNNNTIKNAQTAPIAAIAASSWAENTNLLTTDGWVKTYATAGDWTMTVSDLSVKTILRDPAGANRADTLPTATAINTTLLHNDGAYIDIDIVNTADASENITITTNTGVTLYKQEGATDLVISQGQVAKLRITRTSSTAVKVEVVVFTAA